MIASVRGRAAAGLYGQLLFAIETAEALQELGQFPGWKLHMLQGELKGFWILIVTGNWRLVLHYDAAKTREHASEIEVKRCAPAGAGGELAMLVGVAGDRKVRQASSQTALN